MPVPISTATPTLATKVTTSTSSLTPAPARSTTVTPTPAPTPLNKEITWQAVYSQISQNYYNDLSTEDFIFLVTEALNSDQVTANMLAEWLHERRFEITDQYQTSNLFGNEQSAEILSIEPEGSVQGAFNGNYVGTVIIISKTDIGEYLLTPLEPNWSFRERGSESISIGDYTGNGRIDIARIEIVWGHRGCTNDLSIFEWQGDYPKGSFINIAENIQGIFGGYSLNDCNDKVWTFDEDSIIETYNYGSLAGDCLPYQVQTKYAWRDNTFVKTATASVPFDQSQPTKCGIDWASEVMVQNVPEPEVQDKAVELLANALENWSEEFNTIWGPSSEDYFRFRLGTWYAIRGEVESAKATLQSVSYNPTNTEYPLASQLAETYLQVYQNTGSVQDACEAAVALAQASVPDEVTHENLNQWLKESWGFAEGVTYLFLLGYNWDYICDVEVQVRN